MTDYKKLYEDANKKVATRFGSNVARELFPDLYESEDERMRKAAKHGLQQLGWEHINGIKIKDIIAWLEKQGEQKPTEIKADIFIVKKN